MGVRAIAFVLLALGAAGRTARADDTGKPRALELFAESDKAYKAGEFERAATLLREAYGLYQEPLLLYNLARALEGLGDTKGAIEAYDAYLRSDAKIEDRGAIERRVATLRDQELMKAEARAQRPTPPPPPPRPALVPAPTHTIAPWFVIGGGAVVVGTGVLFGAIADQRHTDAEAALRQIQARDAQDAAKRDATIANVLLVSGGAIVVGGIVWKVVQWRRGVREREQVGLVVGPRGVGIAGAW